MRLIDADALLFELANESFPQSCTYAQGRNGVIDSIRNAPTVDAVPVVRCKDCKYWHDCLIKTWCSRGADMRPQESGWVERGCYDFCSFAERKGDE